VNKHLSLLTTAILPIILVSCSRGPQYPAVLETADSLAYVNPDSAVALLRSVEAEMTASQPAVRHLYDLMTLKAQDKADLPLTSDSLILDILQYYEHGGDPNKLPEAYYYAGRVYSELGDAPQAIDYFQKAQTTLDTLDLRELPVPNAKRYEKLKGIILAQKGYLLRNQHLYQEALDCFNQAYTYNSLVLDTIGMFLDLKDAGGVLSAARDNEQAIHYFDLAAQLAAEYSDSINLDLLTAQKCQCLIWLKRFDEVAKCLQTFQPRITRANFQFLSNMYGEYYWKIGESEKAVPYFKKLYEMGSVYARKNATLWFSDFEMKRGNAKEALRYMAEFSNLELEVRKLRDEEMIALSNSLYNYHFREQENQRLKAQQESQKQRLWAVTFIAIVLAFALFFLFRYMRIRQQYLNSRNEHLRFLLASVQSQLPNTDGQNTRQNEAAHLRSSDIFQLVTSKCASKQVLSDDDWNVLEETLHQYAPEFIPRLKSVYPFSQQEWRVSLLMKYGFAPSEIATATAHSVTAIYSTKTRLCKKVFTQDISFDDWDSFIKSL
jgi:tetratricopeptide (TPR) repeat protein